MSDTGHPKRNSQPATPSREKKDVPPNGSPLDYYGAGQPDSDVMGPTAFARAASGAPGILTDVMLDSITQGMIVVDGTDAVVVFNRAAELFFGVSRREVLGKSYKEVPAEGLGETLEALVGRTRSGRIPIEYEFEHRMGEKAVVHLGVTGTLLDRPSREGRQGDVVLVVRDLHAGRELLRLRKREEGRARRVSEMRERLRQAERKLLRSEKMASLGRMAAAVAHEINNPLCAISGFLEVLVDELEGDEASVQLVREMQGEVNRIERIVKGLLDFARYGTGGASGKRTFIRIVPLVESTLRLAEMQAKVSSVETCFDRGVFEEKPSPEILGDRGQLEQVFLNLALNAVQAMERGGQLTVRVFTRYTDLLAQDGSTPVRREDDPLSADYSRLRTADERMASGTDAGVDGPEPAKGEGPGKGERVVCVEFKDTGPGIDPENVERLFEPFFTTRADGTGLGLSISSGVVRAHGGRIFAARRAEGGSVFTVILPIIGGDEQDEKTA